MRSVLFTIPLDGSLDLGPLGKVPVFGFGLLLAGWALFVLVSMLLIVRQYGWKGVTAGAVMVWAIVGVLILQAPRLIQIPVYGYGTMLFLGFLASATVASRRLRNLGYDGEIAWDVAMWIFVSGIIGARAFYVAQYHDKFFVAGRGLLETLKALLSLPDGGLVFYGGLITGAIAYYVFCRRRAINPLALADVLVTSVFISLMFGRIGCLLNGCCYGDTCTLPWAITFPPESVPFLSEVQRGLLGADARRSLALHPTQIYSALNAGVLALLTWAYYPYRRRDGEVLALGWLAYPVSRFVVEFLRGDEMGQFHTSLTISQWVSLGLFAAGLVYVWLLARGTTRAVGRVS